MLDLYMQNVLLGGKAGSTIAVLVGDGIKSAEALQCTDMVAPPVTATQHCNPWSHLFSLVHVGIQYPYDETMTSAWKAYFRGNRLSTLHCCCAWFDKLTMWEVSWLQNDPQGRSRALCNLLLPSW